MTYEAPKLISICAKLLRSYAVLASLACVASPVAAETFEGEVTRVRDGDSLTVARSDENVAIRLLEIDAPELKQRFGTRSRDSLRELCQGKKAWVTWIRKDLYGRHLGHVWCDGVYVNTEQVRR